MYCPSAAAERVVPDGVRLDERSVFQPLGHDDVHHPERQGRVGAGLDHQHPVGVAGRLGAADVDGDDGGAALAGSHRCGAVVGWLATLAPHMMMVWELAAEVFLGVAVSACRSTEARSRRAPSRRCDEFQNWKPLR